MNDKPCMEQDDNGVIIDFLVKMKNILKCAMITQSCSVSDIRKQLDVSICPKKEKVSILELFRLYDKLCIWDKIIMYTKMILNVILHKCKYETNNETAEIVKKFEAMKECMLTFSEIPCISSSYNKIIEAFVVTVLDMQKGIHMTEYMNKISLFELCRHMVSEIGKLETYATFVLNHTCRAVMKSRLQFQELGHGSNSNAVNTEILLRYLDIFQELSHHYPIPRLLTMLGNSTRGEFRLFLEDLIHRQHVPKCLIFVAKLHMQILK